MTEHIPNPDSKEPALSVGGAAAAVGAILTVLIAFGIDLTETQVKAILGLVLIGGPFAVAVFIRARAYAPATVARLLRSK